MGIRVHLVDGTYELFRHYYALPEHVTADGREVSATRGVVGSVLALLEDGATHVGVATDHVVESFRNDLWDGYKTGEGIDPDLWSQFGPLEDALDAAGVTVWPMVEFEADDGLAAGAAVADATPEVDTVLICTPDKDLAQCVRGDRVVQFDRRNNRIDDAHGVRERFGVDPPSIPDYLALVGDSADGFPGLPGWGAKSASTVLAEYGHLEAIPRLGEDWSVQVRGARRLAATLADQMGDAEAFRNLARLRTDVAADVEIGSVESWRWNGPREDFAEVAASLDAPGLAERAHALAATLTAP
ncbi:MAG: 5'-3' exonuclease H3TH domain-containing protein [Acidimicrobiia bacterium]